jgi:hypothetical protein
MVVVRGSHVYYWPSLDCYKKMVDFCAFFARGGLQRMRVAVAVDVAFLFGAKRCAGKGAFEWW